MGEMQFNGKILVMERYRKSLHESITYAETAKDLWTDLEERYSQRSGIRIHQIKQDITLLSQGDLSVTEYFTRLKELWDELGTYLTLPVCTCGAAKVFNKHVEEEKNP